MSLTASVPTELDRHRAASAFAQTWEGCGNEKAILPRSGISF